MGLPRFELGSHPPEGCILTKLEDNPSFSESPFLLKNILFKKIWGYPDLNRDRYLSYSFNRKPKGRILTKLDHSPFSEIFHFSQPISFINLSTYACLIPKATTLVSSLSLFLRLAFEIHIFVVWILYSFKLFARELINLLPSSKILSAFYERPLQKK